MDSLIKENEILKKRNEELVEELNLTKIKLSKYTNPQRLKKYYNEHKEELLEKQRKRYHDSKEKF